VSAAEVFKAHHIVRCCVMSVSEDRFEQWGQCTGCDFESQPVPIHGVNWETLQRDIYIEHSLDALKAAGFAIVELPQPTVDVDGSTTWPVKQHWGGESYHDGYVAIRRTDGRITSLSTGNPHDCPEDARSLAAALMAAADAAEATK